MADDVSDRREPKWWLYVKMFKTVLEIAAIILAGIWAWFTFTEDTAPSLDKLVDVSSTLGFNHHTANDCEAEYTVTFHNLSKRKITVAKARVRAYYVKKQEAPTDATPIIYFSPLENVEAVEFDSEKVGQPGLDRLTGAYGPGEADTEGFTFFVRQLPGKRILFETALWSDDEMKVKDYLEHPTWVDHRHDIACAPDKSEGQ